MHITAEVVRGWEQRYGSPRELAVAFDLSPEEMSIVEGSAREGRQHDITLFIAHGDKLALIRKPLLPEGAFRAPSGGLYPWETLEVGAFREAIEETGLEISLDRYLLRASARFLLGASVIPWVSHVFLARAVGGQLYPLDRDEILEATYADVAALQGPIRDKMLATGLGLLGYRVALTDAAVAALRDAGGP